MSRPCRRPERTPRSRARGSDRGEGLGPEDALLAAILGNLATACLHEGRLADPRAAASRAVRINDKIFGRQNEEAASALVTLSHIRSTLAKQAAEKRDTDERVRSLR